MSMKRKLAAAALTTLVGGGALIGLAPGAGADPVGGGFAMFDWDDWCGTKVPIKLPPPPPDPWPFGELVLDHSQLVNPAVGVGLADVGLGQLDGVDGIGLGGFAR